MRRLAAVLSLLLPATAAAGWPEDVSLSSMEQHDGIQVGGLDTATLAADYAKIVRELGAAVGTTTALPADSLGVRGFEVAFDTNVAFTNVGEDPDVPSEWDRVVEDETAGPVYFGPGITVRKGLPFSVEIGLKGSWVGRSRQGTFGGFARVALVEGRKPWPDVALHLGYTGYVGNDELELGVLDFGGTLGSRFRLGGKDALKSSSIAPFLDVSLLVVSATPVLDDPTIVDLGVVTYGRRSYSDVLPASKAIPLARFQGGFELRANTFFVRISGGWTVNALGNAAAAVGFVY